MSQTRDQQRFTISEVASDWHEPMVPQHIMWPFIAHANGQLIIIIRQLIRHRNVSIKSLQGCRNWTHNAASRHTIAPISHTRPSPRSRSYYLFPIPLRVGGWVGLITQYVSNLLMVACSGPGVSRTRNLLVPSPIRYHYTTAPPKLSNGTIFNDLERT